MPINDYICLNGEYLKNNEPRLFTDNRAFRYGDALTENIHAFATEPQFLDYHIERLTGNMRILSMETPAYIATPDIKQLIVSLLNKNRIFGGAGIRFTVFRSLGEDLVPSGNSVSFIIESYTLNDGRYELNEKGLSAGISHSMVRTPGPLAHLHRANSTLFLLAGLEGERNKQDTVILLNQAGRLTETVNSNISLASGNSVFTPGTEQGCIPGVMRRVIIKLASEAGYRVNDQSSLTASALLDAEEVFLTNALEGIRWVGAYQQKRYFSKTSRLLIGLLNDFAFGKTG
jgi:branched-chain amino acid aminotransferase